MATYMFIYYPTSIKKTVEFNKKIGGGKYKITDTRKPPNS